MSPAEHLSSLISRELTETEKLGVSCLMGERRRRLRLTQADVANAVGMTLSYISQLEKGHSLPSLLFALRLARFYGCAVEDLWKPKDKADDAARLLGQREQERPAGEPAAGPMLGVDGVHDG